MEKILIFTSFSSLSFNQSDEYMRYRQMKNLHFIDEKPYIVYDYKAQAFVAAKTIKDGDIFFIQHTISEDKFMKFIGDYEKDKVGILKHSEPTYKLEEKYKWCKVGQHETDNEFYPNVVKIIIREENNKFEELQRAIWGKNNSQYDREELVKKFIHEKIYNLIIRDKLPDEIKEYQEDYEKFKNQYDVLPEEEKSLQNNQVCCLVKQLKRDLGL